MFLATVDNAQGYLRDKGWVSLDEPVSVQALPASAGNTVLRISTPNARWVLKQAVGQPGQDERNQRERDCLAYAASVLYVHSVPEIVHTDPENQMLVMSCAPEGATSLQARWLKGELDANVTAMTGSLVGWMHAVSHSDEEVARQFGDKRLFEEVRLSSTYTEVAARHARLAGSIGAHAAALAMSSIAFVHGDFTPENLMVEGERLFLVDFEAGHFGHPCFDTASFLADLTVMALASGERKDEFMPLLLSFWNAYLAAADFESPSWHERSCLPHVGCLLLGRVEHPPGAVRLADKSLVTQARALCASLIQREIPSMYVFLDILSKAAAKG